MAKRVTPEIETFARIRVIGVGGSGGNAINHMINSKVKGVDFIAINTDAQDLHRSLAKKRIHIGKNVTRGLGAGMNPDIGRRAAEETREEIQEALKGSEMVFITCGMGGGTGTGAAPVIARIAKEVNALTVGVVTKPFSFEGLQRMRIAEAGLAGLKSEVDAFIVIPNDKLLTVVDQNTTSKTAFAMCDDILRQAVEGVSDVITTPGEINADFNDIKTIMEGAGPALMGIGVAEGPDRAREAAQKAVNSPLLDVSINGATGVLLAVAGSDDLGILEVQEAAKIATEAADADAKVIFGIMKDERLKKGQIRVIVIATGFPDRGTGGGPLPDRGPSLFSGFAKTEPEDKGGKIFNSVIARKEEARKEAPIFEAKEEAPTVLAETREEEDAAPIVVLHEEDGEDDGRWGAIPSFLRRSGKPR